MFCTRSEGKLAWRRAGILAATFLLPLGCTDDGDTEDTGMDSETGDGDGDPSTGDGDGDPATGDGDGDASTGDGDGDATTGDGDGDPTTGDGDGDPGLGDCGPYPEGPYNWYDNNVVPPDSAFPAMYGPDGEEVTLTMADVHANCKEVKALAFAFGAND